MGLESIMVRVLAVFYQHWCGSFESQHIFKALTLIFIQGKAGGKIKWHGNDIGQFHVHPHIHAI